MRRPVIAGNWKMFKTRLETSAFFDDLIPQIQDVDHCDIVVAPPYTALATAAVEAEGTRVAISAQDVHWEQQGPFTGEISVKMLLDVGCTYTIIGHSERRQYFCETDETVEKKTRAAVAGGLKSIVCVGETLSERDSGQAVEVVRRQVHNGLGRLTPSDLSHIIVAYEPAADALRILYGGSVKPDNISALMKEEEIDGALVGGASLDPASFAAIVKYQ